MSISLKYIIFIGIYNFSLNILILKNKKKECEPRLFVLGVFKYSAI